MKKEEKILLLQKLIDKSKEITTTSSIAPAFQDWKIQAEKTLVKICGETSIELREFKKLNFHNPRFKLYIDMEDTIQHNEAFRRDFETAIRVIKQLINEAEDDKETLASTPIGDTQAKAARELPKIEWRGTQKQLGELFVELKNKGWIESIDKEQISKHFTNANTISEVLKPAVDKSGQPTYERIYTKAYKKSFDKINQNEKNIDN